MATCPHCGGFLERATLKYLEYKAAPRRGFRSSFVVRYRTPVSVKTRP
jgi:hypothetical protein